MFTRLINPSVDAYDIKTGQFIGEARFTPTAQSEQALLNWINYDAPLRSLVMLDSDFQPSENYVPIVPNETYHQRGIFRALVQDQDSGVWLPIEAHGTYDWRSRSAEPGNFLSSVEFDNVKVSSIRIGNF